MGRHILILLFVICFMLPSTRCPAEDLPQPSVQRLLPAPKWAPGKPALFGNQFVAQWEPNPEAAAFRIFIDGKAIATVNANIFTGLAPHKPGDHTLQVAAIDGLNRQGALSTPGVIRVESIPPPGDIRSQEDRKTGAIDIRWTPPAGAVLYKVFRARTADGPMELIETVGRADAYKDPSVSLGVPYWYALTATDINGRESEKSEKVVGQLRYLLRAPGWADGYPRFGDPMTALLKWTSVPGAIGYRIESTWYTFANTGRRENFPPVETASTSIGVSLPNPFDRYACVFMVCAIFPDEMGPPSEGGILRFEPFHLEVANNLEKRGVALSWDPPPTSEVTYSVFRWMSHTPQRDWTTLATALHDNSYLDSTVVNGRDYAYRVFATDTSGHVSHITSVVNTQFYLGNEDTGLRAITEFNEKAKNLISKWNGDLDGLEDGLALVSRHIFPLRRSSERIDGFCRQIGDLMDRKNASERKDGGLEAEITECRRMLGGELEHFFKLYETAIIKVYDFEKRLRDTVSSDRMVRLQDLDKRRHWAVDNIVKNYRTDLLQHADEQAHQAERWEAGTRTAFFDASGAAGKIEARLFAREDLVTILLEAIEEAGLQYRNRASGGYFIVSGLDTIDPEDIFLDLYSLRKTQKGGILRPGPQGGANRDPKNQSLEDVTRILVSEMSDWFPDYSKSMARLIERGRQWVEARQNVERAWSQGALGSPLISDIE